MQPPPSRLRRGLPAARSTGRPLRTRYTPFAGTSRLGHRSLCTRALCGGVVPCALVLVDEERLGKGANAWIMGDTPTCVPWRLHRRRKGSTEQSTMGARKKRGWPSTSRKKRQARGFFCALSSSSALCAAMMSSIAGSSSFSLAAAALCSASVILCVCLNPSGATDRRLCAPCRKEQQWASRFLVLCCRAFSLATPWRSSTTSAFLKSVSSTDIQAKGAR